MPNADGFVVAAADEQGIVGAENQAGNGSAVANKRAHWFTSCGIQQVNRPTACISTSIITFTYGQPATVCAARQRRNRLLGGAQRGLPRAGGAIPKADGARCIGAKKRIACRAKRHAMD